MNYGKQVNQHQLHLTPHPTILARKLLKEKDVSEDEARRGEDAIQKLTDKYIANVDKALEAKEKEMMEV